MKKIFLSIAMLAITNMLMAAITSYVVLEVSDANGNKDEISIFEDATEFTTDFDNDGDATDQPNTGAYGLNFYSAQAWGNASIVAIDNIIGVTINFKSNNYNTDYTIKFKEIVGEDLLLKDNITGREKLIAANDTMKFSQAVNTTEAGRFEIVKKVIPAEPTICHQYGNLIITGHKGAKVKVLDMADQVAIAEQTLATDDEVISLSELTSGEMYQVVVDDGEPMLIRIQ